MMKLEITIEKSFEGEYRACVRKSNDDFDLITMPWVVGQDMAVRQLGQLLSKASVDVVYALKDNNTVTTDFIKNILKRP